MGCGNIQQLLELTIFWNFQKVEEDIGVAAKAKMKEISMEEALWKSADKLRGSVEPSEYKHVVASKQFIGDCRKELSKRMPNIC